MVSEEGLEVVDRKDASASFLSRAGYVDGNGVIGGAGVVLYAYIRRLQCGRELVEEPPGYKPEMK